MRGVEKLSAVDRSTPAMAEALPDLPMAETVMVRLLGICLVGLGRNMEPAFRTAGFTGNSFHVMCLLLASGNGRASPSELSDLLGTSRANVTKILDSLVADGYASRTAEERDGRRQIVRITAAGVRAANRAVPILAEPLRRAFSGLTPAEFKQLDALLRKSILSFDADPPLFGAPATSAAST